MRERVERVAVARRRARPSIAAGQKRLPGTGEPDARGPPRSRLGFRPHTSSAQPGPTLSGSVRAGAAPSSAATVPSVASSSTTNPAPVDHVEQRSGLPLGEVPAGERRRRRWRPSCRRGAARTSDRRARPQRPVQLRQRERERAAPARGGSAWRPWHRRALPSRNGSASRSACTRHAPGAWSGTRSSIATAASSGHDRRPEVGGVEPGPAPEIDPGHARRDRRRSSSRRRSASSTRSAPRCSRHSAALRLVDRDGVGVHARSDRRAEHEPEECRMSTATGAAGAPSPRRSSCSARPATSRTASSTRRSASLASAGQLPRRSSRSSASPAPR